VTRILHHTVRDCAAHLCVHCHERSVSAPGDVAAAIERAVGPPPPAAVPDFAGTAYAVEVFLDWVWPQRRPDVTIIWLAEPDNSYHAFGVGAVQSLEAIRHCDVQFGRVLDWWLRSGVGEEVQLLAMSDHGQISAAQRVSCLGPLIGGGLKVDTSFADGADLLAVPGYPLRLYARGRDQEIIARAATVLAAQAWCDRVFVAEPEGIGRDVANVVPRGAVRMEHPRAPDLCVTVRYDGEADSFGLPGRSWIDTTLPYAANHGGLSPQERACLAIFAGSRFRSGHRVVEPVSLVDLLPTMLAALGLGVPWGCDGVAVGQAFAAGVGHG
jgi:arylsulfatase A-like enzyme